jgi:hypothetical protein
MPEIVPKTFRVKVMHDCGALLHTYDTRSHEDCCPDCGEKLRSMSVPLSYLERGWFRRLIDSFQRVAKPMPKTAGYQPLVKELREAEGEWYGPKTPAVNGLLARAADALDTLDRCVE